MENSERVKLSRKSISEENEEFDDFLKVLINFFYKIKFF